ncbi:E3 ubiquitin-protein ligase rnf213-alpha-like [Hoplias malabaricus]|uniref:E3 ubiquitin-protein ligase rnf213-alpha-like n=1 Tax=Hoplias malabaricus TaxID=27720 RepID=UPI003463112D
MKCPGCDSVLKDSFKFCPECGQRLSAQLGDGNSPEKPGLQQKEGEQKLQDPPATRGPSSEESTESLEDSAKGDPSLDKDACAGTADSKSSAPHDGASMSSQTTDKETTTAPHNTALQNTQFSSPSFGLVRDMSLFQSLSSASAERPGNETKILSSSCLESDCSRLIPAGKDMDSYPPEPEHLHNLNTDMVYANSLSVIANNHSPSVPSSLLKSPATSQRDQNIITSASSANEAVNKVDTNQIHSSTLGTTPEPGSVQSQKGPEQNKTNEQHENTQTEKINKESSAPLEPSSFQTSGNSIEKTEPLKCATGQGEKQNNSSNKKMFGPHTTEKGPAQSTADHMESKQQFTQKEISMEEKERQKQRNTRNDTETPGQVPSTGENDVGKIVSSNQNDELHVQQVSSREENNTHKQTSNIQQESKDITVFFHAILSKDFKLDPSKDLVTLRGGSILGNWKQDILTMQITKDLGQDGYVVHGKLQITKRILGNFVPYKYYIHKRSKTSCEYEYEYIYQDGAKCIVNRCLFIQENLLTKQGEWHQYDDIICARTPERMIDRVKSYFVNMKTILLRGRSIAGNEMLETIYDILCEWNNVNVRNFLGQLQQFYKTLSNPIVYEDQAKPWSFVQYGEAEVKNLLKAFFLEKVSLIQKDRGTYSPDQLGKVVILLIVFMRYDLKMDQNMIQKFGSMLCLPKLSKEDFHIYWTNVLEPLQMEGAAQNIRAFCQIAIDCRTVNWILIIPLLHFLEGDSKPFEQNQISHGQACNDWAGLKRFKLNEKHLTDSQHTRALMKVMGVHKYLIDIDQLLARSWMYVIDLNNLIEYTSVIPGDVLDVFIMLSFRLDCNIRYFPNEQLKHLFSHIHCMIKAQHFRFTDTGYTEHCLKKAVNILGIICKNNKEGCRYEVPLEFLKLTIEIINLKESLHEQESFEALENKRTNMLSDVEKIVREWLLKTFSNPILNSSHSYTSFTNNFEIEAWSKLIDLHIADKESSSAWRKTFLSQFEGKLKQEKALHQIEVYCNEVENVNTKFSVLSSCIENCALEAVNTVCQGGSENTLFEKLKRHDLSKFGKLVSAIVLKAWPRTKDGEFQDGEELVVKHLLTWTTAKHIFHLQGSNGKLIDQLSDKARELMALACSAFSSVAIKFIQGNIEIKILNDILEKEDAFSELLRIDGLCDDGRCKDKKAVKTLFRRRKEEVEDIYHEKEMVKCLLNVCQRLREHIKVDIVNLEEKCQVIMEQMSLDDFMEVHQLDESSSEFTGMVTFFNLSDITRKMAKILLALKDSYIFTMCWENQAKMLSFTEQDDDETQPQLMTEAEPYSLELISEELFEPCYSQYETIYTSLRNENITFQVVDSVFDIYKGKYEEFRKDLEVMCKINPNDDQRWIKERIWQIQQYHDLHLAVESAKVIMDVKKDLCPAGDFHILDRLLEFNTADIKEESLDRIDEDLIRAKEILQDITESCRLCLLELNHRRNLVQWVKSELIDISQLKAFVDIATISAGENAIDVDRVACFHDAILGYSSMLYGLCVDSDFDAFKRALQKLWQALENDSNIANKLRDTSRHLHWLKTVKDSHGSVELSSLSLVTAINARGVYTIGVQNQKKISMETALSLDVPEEHEEAREIRCYSLEDLKDLQNKLMLMSGKAEQNKEVEYFTEVFDHVQRLATIFLDILSSGNPLFRLWEAKITCCDIISNIDEVGPSGIIMDFNLSSIQDKVTVDGNAVEQLPELCKKMDRYLSDWMNFIEKQRSENYYLNYYTAEQIVYLCRQLSLKNLNEDLDDCTLMMLSFINPKSTTSTVWKLWNLIHADSQNVDEVCSLSEDIFNTSMYDFSEKAIGLITLDRIWDTYVTDMKAFLPDTLDISSLGSLLDRLSINWTEDYEDEEEFIEIVAHERLIRRELPKGLVLSRPNLIICPTEEVLLSCISIYSASEYQPLPTFDEVLLCSGNTPYEHVELFLRRCLSGGYMGEKIYCLLYADLLSYDVSNAVEQLFHKLHSVSRKDYKLVIICSLDREHAYMPSAFSQFKLHMIPRESLEKIQVYLSRHYTVSSEQASAATVFKDKQSVGIVSSKRAGVGKSLYIQRLYEKLKASEEPGISCMRCIRLLEPTVKENVILHSLLETPNQNGLVIFHFDVTSLVQKGLQEFLFKLLVLGYLMDTEGHMWKRSSQHLYVIEMLEHTSEFLRFVPKRESKLRFTFFDVFPKVQCRAPKEVLELEIKIEDDPNFEIEDPLMDDEYFRSEAYQRPYQYLKHFHEKADLDNFTFRGIEGTHTECLQMLFIYCGIVDPSWAELRNFAWFLNLQLQDCETSVFCNMSLVGDTLRGFKDFVVDFMILMAKDFATPSLNISDQSPGRQSVDLMGAKEEDLEPFRIRKRWESEPHPYIFFNEDHQSMTFIGFHLNVNDHKGVDAIDPSTNKVIKKNIMTKQLYDGLRINRVPFNINFDDLSRDEKIQCLCSVLGVKWPSDPDETYQLTTDNVLKMMAIHMRFRCGIPVIIMGETGCGKTRLIKFLCELQRSGTPTENLKLVKVHGGTTPDFIYSKVQEAEFTASSNKEKYDLYSVIFFDEANTTEAVSCIKEVLCDNTVQGCKLKSNTGLQIIAACNPYRKHSYTMIERLEGAGLGYIVKAYQTQDKLGSIPLRQLVYRVHALPPSMIPLVWDFGQLNDHTEKMYIHQIVQSIVENNSVHENYINMMTDILVASQSYMRKKNDECAFVSLRDVERCMQVFEWFLANYKLFFEDLKEFLKKKQKPSNNVVHTSEDRDPVEWALLLAVAVCYQSCLEKKKEFWAKLCKFFPSYNKPSKVKQEIFLMQDLLLHDVPLGGTIAKNKALKENVFMMVVCIELRIPLFLVGKPGSSKSLSKTLVADAMQGQAAHSELYRKLKQTHMTSYQCSPHSTAEGIINTFKQCARFQEGKNLKEYVSVVVLDEIGLAEDSPKMPLKTLHPLLEEGCIDDEPHPHKKVGFIGISNWALDPAKMNRGIFVSRGDPDGSELIETATGICSLDPVVLENIRHLFQPLTDAYLKICHMQEKGFFGLRDYYSLIKMIYSVSKASNPSSEQIVDAVLRNFSGLDNVDTLTVFSKNLHIRNDLSHTNTINLVRQNIEEVNQDEDCRYLLILTKNFAGLQILQQNFFSKNNLPEIIFGSSFPKDQEYTQVCKNINRVKICMETGQTVVLLNLQNLYESLYDALNQYYVSLGGQKYVDLGLGTHRVKCRVHKNFRLIVIEEKEVVYKQFPIPLINRLEKHYLDINSVLNIREIEVVNLLQKWVQYFVSANNQHDNSHKYSPPDVFVGFHSDTCSSVVLQVMNKLKDEIEDSDFQESVLEESKFVLLNCATPDSVVRLEYTDLSDVETQRLANTYFKVQKHQSLDEFITSHIQQGHWNHCVFTEVTTFSRLLTTTDAWQLQSFTGIHNIDLISLQQFETELSFLKKLREFLNTPSANKILLVQMDFGEDALSANILASARYSCMNEIIRAKHIGECRVYVYFITKLPRMEGGTSYIGFQGGHWMSVHIDDLRSSQDIVSDVQNLRNVSICELFEENSRQIEDMYVEDTELVQSESEDFVLETEFDTTALVRSCVQSAVSMLKDLEDGGCLSTRRVDILLTLLDNSDKLKLTFSKALKKRLHLLLKAREESTDRPKNWVSREAANIEALQEGGTFKQTLWRRVQTVITPLLAQLISVIDRNCNLDLLLDDNCEDEVKNLWLLIFGQKLLDIPYIQIVQNSEAPTILIQNHISVGRTMSCIMPFSWKIKDLLDDLWEYTLQKEGQTNKHFEEVFKRTVLGEYFANVDKKMQKEFFQRYLQDFIALTMKISTVGEQQLLCAALLSCVNEICRKRGSSVENELSFPLVHTAYYEFQKRLQNFSRMMSILPQVVLILQGKPHVMKGNEMVSDIYCALACVEHLEPQDFSVDFQHLSWLKQVKRLKVPIELICSESSLKHYGDRRREMMKQIHTAWRRIFTFSLFVEHIQLGIEAEDKRLKPLVMEHSRNLWRVLEKNSDMKVEKTFAAVIEILRSCKKGADDLIFKFGLQSCAICQLEPQDPVELPCNHIFCQLCIRRWLIPGQMYCAFCTQPVQDDFEVKMSEDVQACLNLNAQFRQRCNAFFVEAVSTMCFKDNSPPSKGVILHLLSFLMAEARPAALVQAQSHIYTKALSPFDECLDRQPIVRSVVLKLLLKFSFDEVNEYLEQHLKNILQSKILDGADKTELYTLYINCFEDSMFEKLDLSSEAEQKQRLQDGRDFLQYTIHTGRVATEDVSIETLQQIARLRVCLDMCAQLLATVPSSETMEKNQEEFLGTVMELCVESRNDWYRVYLIRKLCRLQGVEVVQNMQSEADFQWLFPQEILQQEETGGQMDQYLVYGEEYKSVRDAVAKAAMEGTVQVIEESLGKCTCAPRRKAFYILLAIFREVTCLFRKTNPALNPRPEQRQTLEDFIHGSQYLDTREMKVFAAALVNNRLGGLSVDGHRTHIDNTLIDLAVHLKAVLLCGSERVLAPLTQLGLFPATMQAAFIPTMPEDMLAVAQKALGHTWYTCPNGHPCVVDKCGRPMQLGRCLECGAMIGGQNHKSVQGFSQVHQQVDRTQMGHILGDPQRRDNPDTLDTKSLSLTPFTLIRMMTHLTMLLGASEEAQSQYIAQIIRPHVQDPCEFLMLHLGKDLEQLGRAVGKGMDEMVTTVHLMFSWALEPPQNLQWPGGYDTTLATKEARNAWEIFMAHNVITPKLKKLEHKLKKVSTRMQADSRVSSNPILKVMYGDPYMFLSSLPKLCVLHSSTVWSCREKGSLLSLTHIVEQNDGKDNFPLLWRFLQKEAEFRLIRFLPDILALQRKLVKMYQNLPDLCSGTIREFIDNQSTASLKSWYEKRIHIFLSLWNKLRVSLATYEVNVPGDYCSLDLDMGSELQVLVPRRQGAGLCATALLSYLVFLHNQLVSAADKHSREHNSYTVSLAELSELHVIRYEVEQDLLPLVLANCQYSMERGRETLSEYDLPKIQQQILTRFLQGKPRISLTGIPTLVSRQERNYENIFKDVREKVLQEPLTSLSSAGLVMELQSLSDVCEALVAVEVTLGFLAMTGEDENMPLETYLEERLQMGSHTAPNILKTLGRCCLKHCVSLWQLLTSLKSEYMLRLKRDPFSGVPAEYKQELGEEEKNLLNGFLSKSNADTWLIEMHEFLLLKLKNKRALETFKSDWSIKDTLASYMERKNLEVPLDVEEEFPEQILLSQLVETWRFSVTHKQLR